MGWRELNFCFWFKPCIRGLRYVNYALSLAYTLKLLKDNQGIGENSIKRDSKTILNLTAIKCRLRILVYDLEMSIILFFLSYFMWLEFETNFLGIFLRILFSHCRILTEITIKLMSFPPYQKTGFFQFIWNYGNKHIK